MTVRDWLWLVALLILFGTTLALFRWSASNQRATRLQWRLWYDQDIMDGDMGPDADFLRRHPDFVGGFIDIREGHWNGRNDWRDQIQKYVPPDEQST